MKQSVVKDIATVKNIIGKDLAKRLMANRSVCYTLSDDAYVLSFYYYDTGNEDNSEERITIYFNKEEIIFVCKDALLIKFLENIPDDWSVPRRLFEFFSYISEEDLIILEKMEDRLINIETQIDSAKKISSLPQETMHQLHYIRSRLLIIKRYYYQLGVVTNDLADNQHGYFSQEEQRYLKSIDKRLDRLLETAQHLQEYAGQVREECQSRMASEENEVMKRLTVITTLFLPLSFIAAWYGMNLKMPEFEMDMGYPLIIGVCVALVIFMIYIFKKKKWF